MYHDDNYIHEDIAKAQNLLDKLKDESASFKHALHFELKELVETIESLLKINTGR